MKMYNICFIVLLVLLPPTLSFLTKSSDNSLLAKNSTSGCLNKLTQSEKDQILHMHNYLRSQIALGLVPGFNSSRLMYELLWDPELEELAQNYMNTNPRIHNLNRSISSHPQDYIGENVLFNRPGPSRYNLSNGVETWFNESLHFTGNVSNFTAEVKKHDDGKIGEFTQLIWAKTVRVGCGIRRCDTLSLICDYWPGGNTVGKQIYPLGEPGSKCEYHAFNYEGLCDSAQIA
jgi:hypothetical protein